MISQTERRRRAQEQPIVGGLPDVPGIGAAIRLTPGLGVHLRSLADELLVHDFPNSTLTRAERELIAMSVSAANDCYFCMDSHGAHAAALLTAAGVVEPAALVDQIKLGDASALDAKMKTLVAVARIVRGDARQLSAADIARAKAAGARDGDVQLAVLIAAAFSMYNRMVEGFRARTAPSTEAYLERAGEIAEFGYSAVPRSASGKG